MIKEKEMSKPLKFLVIADRLELYKDFTINLLYCVHDFYLDKQSFNNPDDMRNHFNWCYNRISAEFEKENFNFGANTNLCDYLFQYYKFHFYENSIIKSKEDITIDLYAEMWNDVFNINKRDEDLIKIMLELYSLFDVTIADKNKIAELV